MRACPHCFSEYVSNVEFCGLDGQRLIETESDPLIGRTIDRYQIVELLGRGGMSVVYRARHHVLGHEYALKIPYGEIALDRSLAERLRREAQVMAKLNHPNIVRVLDFATTAGGASFLVMELLEGRSLDEVIAEEGRLNPETAVRLLRQVALGLQAAHRAGFVHRDLKPCNVMLVGEKGAETAKLLDFGLVRIAGVGSARDTAAAPLTEAGMIMGTPCYMAPEQMRSEPATPVTDIYSLGAVLFEMLSGRPPFRGSLPDILVQQTQSPPVAPPSGGLENLARQMLEREQSSRPQSIDEVLRALDAFRAADEPPVRRPASRVARRTPGLWMALTVAVIGIALWLALDSGTSRRVDAGYDAVLQASSQILGQLENEISGTTQATSIDEKTETCSVKDLGGRLAEVIGKIDGARGRQQQRKMDRLDRRARALRGALTVEGITAERCLEISESVSKVERDVERVVRSPRS
jgi:serine/threonine protein kinase